MDYRDEPSELIRNFLIYHETIQGHSRKTVDEYYLDLRNFFRYIKTEKQIVPRVTPLEDITTDDVDVALAGSVTLSEVYSYLSYLSRDRVRHANSETPEYGISPAARARKVSTLRSFYKYLTNKVKLISENPVQDLDSPRLRKSLPRYLNLEESVTLLQGVTGENKERDFAILSLFLNCGLRISELTNLNLTDLRGEQLRVLGKGNKERVLYLNQATQQALADWLAVRTKLEVADKQALFLTRRHSRITSAGIHYMVKQRLLQAGLDPSQYSSHKLRHTAATLLLKNGVDVRTLQELLGHENLNTTQIYTHVDSESLRLAAQANPLSQVMAQTKDPTDQESTETDDPLTSDEKGRA